MIASPTIGTAGPADTRTVARLMTDAFLAGPLAEWLVPDLAERQRVYARYWTIIATHALAGASAMVDTAGATAAAFWYPANGGPPDLTPDDYDARLLAACGPHAPRFRQLDAAVHGAYPATLPERWVYLAFVAVDPSYQRRGLGRSLLRSRLARLDTTGTTAFLVASSPEVARLYARLGYRLHGGPIIPAPGAPELHPMIRRPPGPD